MKKKKEKEWFPESDLEKQLGTALMRLAEQRAQIYPTDFVEAKKKTLENNQLTVFPLCNWTHFEKGVIPPYVTNREMAKQQWKLFLNPKPSEFQSTLDQSLRVLRVLCLISKGEIFVINDTIKRKLDVTVLDDPCEPKLPILFQRTK